MAAGGVAHRGGPFHRWSRAAARSEDTIPDGRANNTSTLTETEMMNNRPTPNRLGQSSTPPARPATVELTHGDVVIAAITSCTNTSNPTVMLGDLSR
jgi:aconitase A